MENLVYAIYAHFEAKPQHIETVKNILMSLVEPTRKEAGCVKYDFYFSKENPAKILLHEYWKDEQAHSDHMLMPYIVEWQKQKKDLLAHFYDVTFLKEMN